MRSERAHRPVQPFDGVNAADGAHHDIVCVDTPRLTLSAAQ